MKRNPLLVPRDVTRIRNTPKRRNPSQGSYLLKQSGFFKFRAVGHCGMTWNHWQGGVFIWLYYIIWQTGASEWRIPLAQWNKTPTGQINNQERKGVKAKKINTIKSHVWRSEWPQNEDAYVHFSYKNLKNLSAFAVTQKSSLNNSS